MASTTVGDRELIDESFSADNGKANGRRAQDDDKFYKRKKKIFCLLFICHLDIVVDDGHLCTVCKKRRTVIR